MKRTLAILTLFFFFTTVHCYSQVIFDSLIVHYTFNNGQALDLSGNGFHATSFATPTFDRFGNPNSAMFFDGIDDYIEFPTNTELKPELPLSFAFILRFEGTNSVNDRAVFTNDYVENLNTGIQMAHANIHYGDCSGSGVGSRRSYILTAIPDSNVWFTIVGVMRGPTDMDVYVNGLQQGGNFSGSGGTLCYTNNPGCIGRYDNANNPPYYMKGTVDEFFMWNRALSQTDVSNLQNLTSVKDLSTNKTDIDIFPNPTNSLLNILSSEDFNQIEIYSSLGELIIRSAFKEEIDLKNINAGFYFIRLTGKSNQYIEKIIVE